MNKLDSHENFQFKQTMQCLWYAIFVQKSHAINEKHAGFFGELLHRMQKKKDIMLFRTR